MLSRSPCAIGRLAVVSPAARDATVLVVDDDPEIIVVVRDALVLAGYHVLTARDGAEALLVLRGLRVDLVLLDLLMVGMNGWEFFEALCREPGAPKPPVVIMSGSPEALAKTRTELFVDALPKPFTASAVIAVVERHVGRSLRSRALRM